MSILERWIPAAEAFGVPKDSYNKETRMIEDKSQRQAYSFALIFNPHRIKRYHQQNTQDCPLCATLQEAKANPEILLFPQEDRGEFTLIPNKFPSVAGASVALSREHRPMYTTQNLSGLAEGLDLLLKFKDREGFCLHHNSEGAGASIPSHEHYHLTNYKVVAEQLGKEYGFEAADLISVARNQVYSMPSFPFAHLIFTQDDPQRITSFLQKLGENIGSKFQGGVVPHILAQGRKGILVAPFKTYEKKGIGAGDVTGNLSCSTREEFEQLTYQQCMDKLSSRLFTKEELTLERLL